MKKGALVLGVVALALLVGCSAGPSYLSRTVDDMQNNNYEKDPLVTSLLSDVLPVYPIVKFFAAIPDVLVLNFWQFWRYDVWDKEGTAFVHENPEGKRTPWFR